MTNQESISVVCDKDDQCGHDRIWARIKLLRGKQQVVIVPTPRVCVKNGGHFSCGELLVAEVTTEFKCAASE